MKLTEKQKKIVDTPGNVIVRASAGTGKTHTMVAKIEKEIEENRSHRVIAAITFTIKAAREIKERLSVDSDGHFIGTNNSFAIEEVIKPFMRDAYGESFDSEMTTDYILKFNSYDEGITYISQKKTLGSYEKNYKNFIFELALKILKKSKAARLYLQAKYFKIYVDEYQDCDKDMNEFFIYLSDSLHIDLFVVGDDKQSIYTWRGAKPEAFRSILKKDKFTNFFMSENFRSNKQIQNYSNLLFEETSELYSEQTSLENIIFLKCTNQDWFQKIKRFWDENKSSALLRYSNADAENDANILRQQDMDFKYIPKPPIQDISNEAGWLYYAIAQFLIVQTYSVFDFIYDIPSGTEDDSRITGELKKSLEEIRTNIYDEDKFKEKVSKLAESLGYQAQSTDLNKLWETVCTEKYVDAFKSEDIMHRTMTFHSSKGLQFDQVILFVEDYNLQNDESFYNHYVATTRAKNKLIFISIEGTYSTCLFYQNLSKKLKQSNLKLNQLVTIVD
ncbi:UvrD-helicase domain-containing protein [Fructobacillus tropaeoli]|uniref:UvrD-helicase domain-containing protein n=1 Tax=Fructobacillus tropaeoli TaxID=709323 RepID=UPI002DAD9B48|nr:Superfamily I DNA or RNA helicase (UvrD) [Fructobacillus tropaeoli]